MDGGKSLNGEVSESDWVGNVKMSRNWFDELVAILKSEEQTWHSL